MRFTRTRDLLIPGAVVAVLVHLLLRVAYDSVPPLPRLAGVTLLVLAVVEALFGLGLRSRINRDRDTKPLQPMTAVRAMALAKASSLVGAIMFGAWLGVLAYTLPRRPDLSAAANDSTSAAVGLISSALLVGAALWLEYCCRTPKGPEDRDDRSSARNS